MSNQKLLRELDREYGPFAADGDPASLHRYLKGEGLIGNNGRTISIKAVERYLTNKQQSSSYEELGDPAFDSDWLGSFPTE